jgi:hypothetical protein
VYQDQQSDQVGQEAETKRYGFGMVFRHVTGREDLSFKAKSVYMALTLETTRRKANKPPTIHDQTFTQPLSFLVLHSGLKLSSVKRGLAELEAKGIIEKTNRSHNGGRISSEFRLNDLGSQGTHPQVTQTPPSGLREPRVSSQGTQGEVSQTPFTDSPDRCQAPGFLETGLAGFQGCGDRAGHRV